MCFRDDMENTSTCEQGISIVFSGALLTKTIYYIKCP